MSSRIWAFALVLAMVAAPLSASLAAGSGAAAAGGVGDKGDAGTGSPRASLDTDTSSGSATRMGQSNASKQSGYETGPTGSAAAGSQRTSKTQ